MIYNIYIYEKLHTDVNIYVSSMLLQKQTYSHVYRPVNLGGAALQRRLAWTSLQLRPSREGLLVLAGREVRMTLKANH